MRLRAGTRGSELALIQTRWVCEQLRRCMPDLVIEEVIISTHGDVHPAQPVVSEDWPMGGFTSAIERALLEKTIDFAVHSLKDLLTFETHGTRIAAIPKREAAHDVLITTEPVTLESLTSENARTPMLAGMRIGTSSPRRAAQIRRLGTVQTVPLRGNVPTRLERVGRDLDGVILAAAGMRRLGLAPKHMIDLPLDTFLPAPGQGALAVQVRDDNDDIVEAIAQIDNRETRLATTAERGLLRQLGGGCSAPVGAYATLSDNTITLRGQVFSSDGEREAMGDIQGYDAFEIAQSLAKQLQAQLDEVQQ